MLMKEEEKRRGIFCISEERMLKSNENGLFEKKKTVFSTFIRGYESARYRYLLECSPFSVSFFLLLSLSLFPIFSGTTQYRSILSLVLQSWLVVTCSLRMLRPRLGGIGRRRVTVGRCGIDQSIFLATRRQQTRLDSVGLDQTTPIGCR